MAADTTTPDPLAELYEENRPGSTARVDRSLKEIAAAITILTGDDARITSGERKGDVRNKAGRIVSAKYSMHKADSHGHSHAIDLGLDSIPLPTKKERENFAANLARVAGYKNIYVSEHGGTGEHIHIQTGPDNLGKLNPSSSDFKVASVKNKKGRTVSMRVERDAATAEAELLRDLAKIHKTTPSKVIPLLVKMMEENNKERSNLIGHALDDMSGDFQHFVRNTIGAFKTNEPQVAAADAGTKTAETQGPKVEEPGILTRIGNIFNREKALNTDQTTKVADAPVRPPASITGGNRMQPPTRPAQTAKDGQVAAQDIPNQPASKLARAKRSDIHVGNRGNALRAPVPGRNVGRGPAASAPSTERVSADQLTGIYSRTGLSAFDFGRTQQAMMGINMKKAEPYGTDDNKAKAREFMKSVVGDIETPTTDMAAYDKDLATKFAARIQTYQEKAGHLKSDGILGKATAKRADTMVAQAYKRQRLMHAEAPLRNSPYPA